MHNVCKSFGKKQVLTNVCYTFRPGSLYVLLGHSGSGKSTLLHVIAKLLPATSGTIEFKGKQLSHEHVNLVLQQPHFFGDLTIGDNINLNTLFNKRYKSKNAVNFAKTLQIDTIFKRKASVCSGGEKARANLVRGLCSSKSVLLIDEPTAHLDALNSQNLANLLLELSQEKIVIVTTHERNYFTFPSTVFLQIEKGNLYENPRLL